MLTKEEVIQALEDGKTVKHRSFTQNEWMKKAVDRIRCYEFEDGCICPFTEFWSHRTHENWLKDWEIVK